MSYVLILKTMQPKGLILHKIIRVRNILNYLTVCTQKGSGLF